MSLETTKVFLPPQLRWPMTAVLAVTSGFAFVEARSWPLFALAAALGIGALITVTMCSWLQIHDDRVVLHLWPLYRRVIAREDILQHEITAHTSPMKYGGYGLRIWTGRTLALVTRTGPMLHIKTMPGTTFTRLVISLASNAEADQVRQALRPNHIPST